MWYWPGRTEVNDFPDPVGIEGHWHPWKATMAPGPSVQAEIFTREYIQNSWDSIQKKCAEVEPETASQAAITFRFVELEGEAAGDFCEAFGLSDHIARLAAMDDGFRGNNRIPEESVLFGDSIDRIRLLVASESLGEGMHGSWDHGDDVDFDPPRMKIATIQTETGKVNEGTGGSWGEGKKAVVAASLCRTLAVYSCHDTVAEMDPDVHSRFMGVTYWKSHVSGGRRRSGLGLLGVPLEEGAAFADFRPFENESADEMVTALAVPGFDVRDPGEVSQHGTSYLFVDPAFTPDELVWAIERNWWPLIEKQQLNFKVVDYDDQDVVIHPREQTQLEPFMAAFDIALGREEARDEDVAEELESNGKRLGLLGLTSDQSDFGWSFDRTTEEGEQNRDLIALIRNDMVIAYDVPFQRGPSAGPPLVRGAFVVDHDEELNRNLKMSEGKLHNAWSTDKGSVPSGEARRLVKSIREGIQATVKDLKLKAERSNASKPFRIKAFEDVFAGKGNTVRARGPKDSKPRVPRDFSIQGVGNAAREHSESDPTKLRFTATAQISLRDHVKVDEMDVEIHLGWKVAANTTPDKEPLLSDDDTVELPPGFEWDEGRTKIEGKLSKSPVSFKWTTKFFPDDWQVIPHPVIAKKGDAPE